VAVSADVNPRAVSAGDVYTIAFASENNGAYRICVVGRTPDGGAELRAYRELAAPALGPNASPFIGLIATHGPDLARHEAAARKTRYGAAVVGGDPYGGARRAGAEGAEAEESAVLAAALRNRLAGRR
jgi:hypothetical protein